MRLCLAFEAIDLIVVPCPQALIVNPQQPNSSVALVNSHATSARGYELPGFPRRAIQRGVDRQPVFVSDEDCRFYHD